MALYIYTYMNLDEFSFNTGFIKSAIQYVKVHINKLLEMHRLQ
jgi:hypothetical protein